MKCVCVFFPSQNIGRSRGFPLVSIYSFIIRLLCCVTRRNLFWSRNTFAVLREENFVCLGCFGAAGCMANRFNPLQSSLNFIWYHPTVRLGHKVEVPCPLLHTSIENIVLTHTHTKPHSGFIGFIHWLSRSLADWKKHIMFIFLYVWSPLPPAALKM